MVTVFSRTQSVKHIHPAAYTACGACRQSVREVRAEEAKVMRTMATYQAFFGLTLFIGPVMVSIASFAAYTGAPLHYASSQGCTARVG